MKISSFEHIVALRRVAQQFSSDLAQASDVAQKLCGLQAQDVNAALLSIRARSHGLTAAGVNSEWHQERALARAWCMRGTLHMVVRDDLGWMLPLFGPTFIKKTKRRYQQLGLNENDCLRAVDRIAEILLAHGGMTRLELAKELAREGIPTEGQAIFHLIRRAALSGVLCYGPYRDGAETFILLDLPLSDADEQDLINKLALRYLAAYGPAQPADFAYWSGLKLSQARRGFEQTSHQLEKVKVDGKTYYLLEDQVPFVQSPMAPVCLLPAFDTFLLGYQSRHFLLEQRYTRRVHPGGGLIHPTVLARDRIVATWKVHKQKRRTVIWIVPFEPLSLGIMDAIEAEIADMGRFLNQDIVLAAP